MTTNQPSRKRGPSSPQDSRINLRNRHTPLARLTAALAAIALSATIPALAQTGNVSTDKLVYCIGDTVYVTVTTSPGAGNVSACVGIDDVPLHLDESGRWVGQVTAQESGMPWVHAEDNEDTFNEFQISVVKLKGIKIGGDPMYSPWFHNYPGTGDNAGSGDYAALASGDLTGDTVVLAADVEPYTDEAAGKITWYWDNSAHSAGGTLLHGVDVSTIGIRDADVSACGATFHYNVWAFWVTMSLKTSGPLDNDDTLRFNDPNQGIIFPGQPYGPDTATAGSYFGMATKRPTYNCYGGWARVELTGTLEPAGVGDFLTAHGVFFTFGPQYILWAGWDYPNTQTPTSPTDSGGWALDQGGDSPLHTDQPVNDKIFALDIPGIERTYYADRHYLGIAMDFETYAYVDGPLGPAQASDPFYWYNRVKVLGNGRGGASAVPPPLWDGVKAGNGTPYIPTDWGDDPGFDPDL